MNIKLLPDLEADVHTLTSNYGYSPGEIVSIGVAMATVLLREKQLGNRVVVVDADNCEVAEFKEIEPQAVREVAERYIRSLYAGFAEVPTALLLARLERERDEEVSLRKGQRPS